MSLRDSKRGFTLIELLIAITVFLLATTASLAFMARENTAFQMATKRLSAVRNLRYAVTSIEQDLRTLGINVPEGQPELVYAGPSVVAFTADYATNLVGDPFAVFRDVDAPGGQVALPAGAVTIPSTSFTFPDTTYGPEPGVRSPAELIIFYFETDGSTARSDDFRLMRQVNSGPAEVVARSLLQTGSQPFFSYQERSDTGLVTVPAADLPLAHTMMIHNAPADTGAVARIDDIRVVGVEVSATNGVPGGGEVIVSMTRTVDLPNAGLRSLSVCGDSPILGTAPSVSAVSLPSGDPAIQVDWSSAVDENNGEKDVVRYVLWRRIAGGGAWGDPYVAVPAGESSYLFTDTAIVPGQLYEYGLAAQDCTPSLSPVASSPAIGVSAP